MQLKNGIFGYALTIGHGEAFMLLINILGFPTGLDGHEVQQIRDEFKVEVTETVGTDILPDEVKVIFPKGENIAGHIRVVVDLSEKRQVADSAKEALADRLAKKMREHFPGAKEIECVMMSSGREDCCVAA